MLTVLLVMAFSVVEGGEPADSTSRATLVITPRLHSAGYFPFTGALVNRNPVADLNIFYEKNRLGFFLFKSQDLSDRHSIANYFQPGIFTSLKLSQSLKVRVFFGYIFSQTQGFRDGDSDYYTAASLYWSVGQHFRVENTLLYYDFTINHKVANRLLLEWGYEKIKVQLFVWNRIVIDERQGATSASLAITFPMIKLNERVALQFTSAYQHYLSDSRPSFALRGGPLFTVSVPINL